MADVIKAFSEIPVGTKISSPRDNKPWWQIVEIGGQKEFLQILPESSGKGTLAVRPELSSTWKLYNDDGSPQVGSDPNLVKLKDIPPGTLYSWTDRGEPEFLALEKDENTERPQALSVSKYPFSDKKTYLDSVWVTKPYNQETFFRIYPDKKLTVVSV